VRQTIFQKQVIVITVAYLCFCPSFCEAPSERKKDSDHFLALLLRGMPGKTRNYDNVINLSYSCSLGRQTRIRMSCFLMGPCGAKIRHGTNQSVFKFVFRLQFSRGGRLQLLCSTDCKHIQWMDWSLSNFHICKIFIFAIFSEIQSKYWWTIIETNDKRFVVSFLE
jgi:hypothetical protein